MLFNLSKVGRRAFTLVELIIVIVIVGILAAISIVGYQSVVDRSEQAAAETTLQSVDREYRALAAFNMAADPSAGVSIADMTVIDGIDYTAGDTDSDGLLEPGETVTFDGVVLTLATATTTGDLSTSASDDGSSESAGPYVTSGSYTNNAGHPTAEQTYSWTVERTGTYSFTITGVFEDSALDPWLTSLTERGLGTMYASHLNDNGEWSNHVVFYNRDGDIELSNNANGEAEWTMAFTVPEWGDVTAAQYGGELLTESELNSEKAWFIYNTLHWQEEGAPYGFGFNTHPLSYSIVDRMGEPLVIPAWEG